MIYYANCKLYLDGRDNRYIIYAKQLDTLRCLKVEIVDNNEQIDLTQYTKAEVRWLKPDGNECHNDATISNNKVIVELTQQMLAVDGEAKIEVILYSNSNYISTGSGIVRINRNVHNDDNIESNSEYQSLVSLLGQYDLIKNSLDNAEDILAQVQVIENAETSRVTAEQNRASAETTRQTAYSDMVAATGLCNIATTNANLAVDRANTAAQNCEDIAHGLVPSASAIPYNNSTSGSTATNIQNAIDESLLYAIQNASDVEALSVDVEQNSDDIVNLNSGLLSETTNNSPSNEYFDVSLFVKQNSYLFSLSALIINKQAIPNNTISELPILLTNSTDIEIYTQAYTNTGRVYAVSKNSNQKLQIENYTGAEIPVNSQLKINLTMIK